MQTINITYVEVTRELDRADRVETFTCRVAAMARMVNLLDAGVDFVVDQHACCSDDVAEHIPQIRHVTLWDEMALLR